MEKLRAFLKRKDIVFSAKRYFIDAMGAMAQGLFCTLLVFLGNSMASGLLARINQGWEGRHAV